MIIKRSALLLASFVTLTAHASAFLGTYKCTGHDPYLNEDYKGTLVVKQQNTVYSITMTYNTGEKYKGTGGQYNEELMSVVFQDPKNPKIVGLEQYHMAPDHKTMGGFWVYLGKDKLGRESCIRQDM